MDSIANFYNITSTELSAGIIIFNLLFAFILQLIIVYVYKKTRHGLSYSQSFVFTLIIVGTLGAAVMMAVQNNVIGALAIFGAFTLIRFRSILKEVSDLAYVFFSLVLGISVGMGHYPLALLTCLFLSTVIYLFFRFGFGSVSDNFDYLLIFSTSDKTFDFEKVKSILKPKTSGMELLHVKQFSNEQTEYSVSIRTNKDTDPVKIANEVRSLSHVENLELITGKNTSEF